MMKGKRKQKDKKREHKIKPTKTSKKNIQHKTLARKNHKIQALARRKGQ
jgi:hypothetical protein